MPFQEILFWILSITALSCALGVVLSRNIYETKVGGMPFSAFEITGKANDVAYRQVYLATVRKGLAIFFVGTFYDNRNTFAVEASLKTLRFGK